MAKTKLLPPFEFLDECFHLDAAAGTLFWRESRPLAHFASERYQRMWTTRFAGREAGWFGCYGYRHVNIAPHGDFRVHRLIYVMHHRGVLEPHLVVDHINQTKADNRISNLRLVTHKTNVRNARKKRNNRSGVNGVNWREDCQCWRAEIQVDGKTRHLGHFDNIEDAAAARLEANKLHNFSDRHGAP